MIAVGFEKVGADDFVSVQPPLWDADKLFLDVDADSGASKMMHKLLGTTRGSLFHLLRPGVFRMSGKAKKESVGGDVYTGDGLQLGGVWIFDKKGEMVFAHPQRDFTDQPKPEDVLKAAKAAAAEE